MHQRLCLKMGKITDIFYRNKNSIEIEDSWSRKIFENIADCGSGRLGTTSYICSNCKALEIVNASCGSRNCPNCGGSARAKWVEDSSERLFPVKHFHAVFTLPHELNGLIALHKKTMLNLLINSVSETLMLFSKETFDGIPAFMMVLHSWTQKLEAHYHVHVLIASGTYSDGKWKEHKKKFLFPIRALSTMFRAKYLSKLSKKVIDSECSMFGKSIPTLPEKWNVYCAPPYSGADTAVKYFGQYANRVGISNSRILSVNDGMVEIAMKRDAGEKDPTSPPPKKDSSTKKKSFEISEIEFVKRFCLHILPKGFCKIRYFGLYSPRSKIREMVRSSLEKIKIGNGLEISILTVKKCGICKVGILYFFSRSKLSATGPPQ